jgi:ABC-type polysaccharide/polyol phosphate transport system ATPase subunit
MPAVTFTNVSKYFFRHAGRILLRDRLVNLLRPSQRERFYALRDVSFAVEPGESLGVIGSNGAGKSTLLNLATRLCFPSDGEIEIDGRVAALLELGSGFHQDLTGAENVRINAALLGLSRRQARERFDEIVEFSGIGEFINEPLRTYSSGMSMRLAFSVAINVDPDILIVDEVLGVGDQNFFAKCFDRLLEFRHRGKTLICVSHSSQAMSQLCDRGLWLNHGQVVAQGAMHEVLKAYSETANANAAVVGE